MTVTPGQNGVFQITVKRVGASRLRVTSQGVSKDLMAKLKDLGNAVQGEIAQASRGTEPPADRESPGSRRAERIGHRVVTRR